MQCDAKITFLGRLDVALHVLYLLDDAFYNGRLMLEKLWRKLLVQPALQISVE